MFQYSSNSSRRVPDASLMRSSDGHFGLPNDGSSINLVVETEVSSEISAREIGLKLVLVMLCVEAIFSTPYRSIYLLTHSRVDAAVSAFIVVGLIAFCFCFQNPIHRILRRFAIPLPQRMTAWLVLWLIFGSIARIGWSVRFPVPLKSDNLEYFRIAEAFASGQNPHTTFWPPGFPLSLAPLFVAFGSSQWVRQLYVLLLFTATYICTYAFASQLRLRVAAYVAPVLVALWPGYLTLSGVNCKENLLAFLIPASLFAYAKACRTHSEAMQGPKTPSISYRWLILSGLWMGFAALTQPAFVLFPTVIFGIEALRNSDLLRTAWITGVYSIALVLAIAPWTFRNYLVYHRYVLISTNGGSVFYRANNPLANANFSPEGELPLPKNQFDADKAGYRLARQWIFGNPGAFASLMVKKQIVFLGDDAVGAYETLKRDAQPSVMLYSAIKGVSNLFWLSIWVIIALGTRSLFKERNRTVLLGILVLPLGYQWLIDSVFESGPRHHLAYISSLSLLVCWSVESMGRGAWVRCRDKRIVHDRSILQLLVYCLFALLIPPLAQSQQAQSETQGTSAHSKWFVRPDGGDRNQCSGRSDAPYQGETGSACAFKNPHYLFTNDRYGNKEWIIKGGDTIIIRGGPYRMGYKGPNPKDYWGNCPGDPYGCSMPPLPSGTSSQPTRLLGENFESCSKKTQLYGGYGLGTIINLKGSKDVDLECLELTDHTQCSRVGGGYPKEDGCNSSNPLSDYAGVGIRTDAATSSVVIKNLDVHGLVSAGIAGPIGGDVVADHVRIAFNGSAGWDFDDGRGTKNAANSFVHASYLTIEWNGCNEEYPITHAVPAYNCFDQDHAGYGDGLGTQNTPLSFTCDHCVFRYNTQDGLDLLHASGGVLSIKNSASYGNMGQQWKIGAMKSVVFRNNVTVHNCKRLSTDFHDAPKGYNKYLSLFCRAAGDGIALAVNDDGTYVFQNNSFAGYGSTSYDIFCVGVCTKPNIIFQNNLHVGYGDPKTRERPGVFYLTGFPHGAFAARDHNIYYNMRTCPSGANERCVDPKIANQPAWNGEASLDHIDFHLTKGSPAEGAGVLIPDVTADHDGIRRMNSRSTAIGAFLFVY